MKTVKAGRLGISGFALVEVMADIAVLGLLSAIAVPNYVPMVFRTRRSKNRINRRLAKN